MNRTTSCLQAGSYDEAPSDQVTLAHDARHLRRKLLTLENGEDIMVDFPAAIALRDGDALQLDDGRLVKIVAAQEDLYEVTAQTPVKLTRLVWHLGNRHLPTQIEETYVLVKRDHVIRDMLEGLGAIITDLSAAFEPTRGAYLSTHHTHNNE